MFDDIKNNLTSKMLEVRIWLNNMNDNDDFSRINKGLYYVYVYGIYEETVRGIIQQTIFALDARSIRINDCIFDLYPLIFSKEYDSIYGVGNEHKWERRWNISERFKANDLINIPCEEIPTDGKNIRVKQLQSIIKSFGITSDVLPRPEIGGHIQEMVNNRNYIAHGNKTPKEVGGGVTINDLKHKLDCIIEECTYLIDTFEDYIVNEKYLR